ncbi:MAG: QacE family quaternary ammonium compound efflux SMR transporter [Thioclava marina]|jgi:Membrane transporters of cations and cationic drugs|uniref:DMT family transporter n=1 Tax=Thioclava TaxID=285107 RepID=UPI000996A4B5|nr:MULTISPECIES: SMR family transporter [Thioclava]MBC7143779.1 QacE family quaternary ammonium compound efflux SMR transporter [Thioclava marina]MBD3802643.1 QacE family quaternary ammonium compound efflux SMR transporter [Thioclava sp.]TNE83806.1 MAG: QacE family quaternary ammonium compound efflux SMR transporter [Paracoccaceae bacterium]TNF13867.1 MAG: QacE family quaternary ammonium compound efflux SMR transporter [Paracoccaceae bacterium]
MIKTYLFLLVAVAFETFGSACLQASQQFTRFWPTVGVAVGFIGGLYFFTLVLKVLPLGITYALWSGIGMVLIASVGWLLFNQRLDAPALIGIGLILAGIMVINLFSRSHFH